MLLHYNMADGKAGIQTLTRGTLLPFSKIAPKKPGCGQEGIFIKIEKSNPEHMNFYVTDAQCSLAKASFILNSCYFSIFSRSLSSLFS